MYLVSLDLSHLHPADQSHILELGTGSHVLEHVGDVGVEVIPAEGKVLLRPHYDRALILIILV